MSGGLPLGLLASDIGQCDLELEVAHCVRGVVSPLLANIALSVLDEHFVALWKSYGKWPEQRTRRRRNGLPTCRLVRYADDFVVMVSGTCAHAEALQEEAATVLAPVGLRLSEEKTAVVHIDEGFDFLGFRIQRQHRRGTEKAFVYTWPSKKALASVKAKVRTISRQGLNQPLADLLRRLSAVLRGWTNYFRHGVSKATFNYLRAIVWQRVIRWLRRKHSHASWKQLRHRHLDGWWPGDGDVVLFDPAAVTVTRYRYRGAVIPSPWERTTTLAPV
jgi:RNA-directed DNA polymerase